MKKRKRSSWAAAVRDTEWVLVACWLICVLSPSLLAFVDAVGLPLSGRLLYGAIGLGFVGGCGCVMLANHRWTGRAVAMAFTICLVAAEVLVLGTIFFARDGAVGTQ